MANKLIIGCGYLGSHIASLWCARQHQVFATTRSTKRAVEWRTRGLQPIICDVLDLASLCALPKVETIVYCVGMDRSSVVSMRTLYVNGLSNVLASLPTPAPRFIYVSSTSVYGQTAGEEVDEDAATEPQEEAGKIVLEAEYLLRSRLPSAIVLRFAGIYGPGRLIGSQLIQAGEMLSGDAESWLNLIHVEDGAAVVVAADERAFQGSIYNVSDGVPVRRGDYYAKLAEVLKALPPRFSPVSSAKSVAYHRGGNRQIVNRRMLRDLRVELKYPDFSMGLNIAGSALRG